MSVGTGATAKSEELGGNGLCALLGVAGKPVALIYKLDPLLLQ
jgi:hypothetical protein